MEKQGFKPIINSETEILILGTLPSDISIQTGEYYANSKNQFWKIIYKIFNDGISEFSYNKKIELLLKNKIGLWDVLTVAKRNGSLDSNIYNEKFNDFEKLFDEFPKLKIIVFNGNRAGNYFKSFEFKRKGKLYYTLPSTSSANTWKTFDEKYKDWNEILKKTVANTGS